MRFAKSIRTDLVISMTLAEIFLLLLFVVWYGYKDTFEAPNEIHILQAQNARLIKEVAELRGDLTDAKEKIQELEKRLEIWRNLTGIEEPPTPEEFDTFLKEACRSNPKCFSDNTLISVTVIEGDISMKLLVEVPEFILWMSSNDLELPKIGEDIMDLNRIDRFLNLTLKYYHESKDSDKECRFDYNLNYRTKADYHDGRQKFESVFYPGIIRKIN